MKVCVVKITDGGKADDVSFSVYASHKAAWTSLWEEFFDRAEELPLEAVDQFLALSQEEKEDRWNEEIGLDLEMYEDTLHE